MKNCWPRMVAPEAEALGCEAEVQHAREILDRGTSAQSQVRVHDDAIAGGATKEEALRQVVDWLVAETVRGL